jgi:hypothetical protein
MVGKAMAVIVSGSNFGHLTVATRHRITVTLTARLCVVDGSQPIADLFLLVEGVSVGFKRGLIDESIGLVIKSRGCLGSGLGIGCLLKTVGELKRECHEQHEEKNLQTSHIESPFWP